MSDPNELIRKRQKIFLIGGVGGIFLLVTMGMFWFDSGSTKRLEKLQTIQIVPPGGLDDRDAWRAHQAAREKLNETRIEEMRAQLKAYVESSERLERTVKDLEAQKQYLPAFEKDSLYSDSNSFESNRSLMNDQNELPTDNSIVDDRAINTFNQPIYSATDVQEEDLEIISFEPDNKHFLNLSGEQTSSAKAVKKTSRSAIEFIPAGSFVRVAMLNGVDAPTGGQAQSNPLPVAFHALDLANLANKHKLDIKDCRFIAAVWGDLSSERMMGRTETLSCLINGESIEMPIKGQVIGEDGKAGVRGRLITKQGQLLANALFAGALSGIGKAFQQTATVTSIGGGSIAQTIDPRRAGITAVGGGMSSASEMLARYYIKAADKLFPIIETDGGRVVEILITKGAVYSGKGINKERYQALIKRANVSYREKGND